MSITLNSKVQRTENVNELVAQFLLKNKITVARAKRAKGISYFNVTVPSKHRKHHNFHGAHV